MQASKMKRIADQYNEALKTKKETEVYKFLMRKIEEEARAGRYKYEYAYNDFNPPCRINTLIEMLIKEGYSVFTYSNNICGVWFMLISWEDLKNDI